MKMVRFEVPDSPGAMGDLTYILGKARIALESMDVSKPAGALVVTIVLKDERHAIEVIKNNGFKILEGESKVASVIVARR